MSLFFGFPLGESLPGFGSQGRNVSLRSHNQRGSPVPGDRGLEPVQPELGMIVMHILRGCAWYARMIRRRLTLTLVIITIQALVLLLLNFRQFRFRIEFFRAQLLGAVQGCESVVGPHSLKVGLAVGRAWRSPRSFPRLAGGGWNREHEHSH